MPKPTLLEYAICANSAYYDNPTPPPGWEVYCVSPKILQSNGYRAVAFIRKNKDGDIDLMLAQRGTEDTDNVIEDIEMELYHHVPETFKNNAQLFTEDVLNSFPKGKKVNVYFTGHSLGATLAELCIASGLGEGVTFESPGSKALIIKLMREGYFRGWALDYAAENVKPYKTHVDAINTAMETPSIPIAPVPVNQVIKALYPRIGGFLPLPLYPGSIYFSNYTLEVMHPMVHILKWIKKNPNHEFLINERPWPIGFENALDHFLSLSWNKQYLMGYINQLWNDNGVSSDLVRIIFCEDFKAFQKFYLTHVFYKKPPQSDQANRIRESVVAKIKTLDCEKIKNYWLQKDPNRYQYLDVNKHIDDFCRQFVNETPVSSVYPNITAEIGRSIVSPRTTAPQKGKANQLHEQQTCTYAGITAAVGQSIVEHLQEKQLISPAKPSMVQPRGGKETIMVKKIINQLQQYADRIKANKNARGQNNYRYGFWVMKASRALNREANYYLVCDIVQRLERGEYEQLAEFFCDDSVNAQRSRVIQDTELYKNKHFIDRGIQSKELNTLLQRVREQIGQTEDDSRLYLKGCP